MLLTRLRTRLGHLIKFYRCRDGSLSAQCNLGLWWMGAPCVQVPCNSFSHVIFPPGRCMLFPDGETERWS